MKRIVFTAITMLSTSVLYAQKDTSFYRHEVRASFGEAISCMIWLQNEAYYANFSVAYFYRSVKWFWVGGNFVNYFGEKLYYNWREYYSDGSFKDFSESKIKYAAAIAPEIRFSFLNKRAIILYGALSAGIGWENGYDNKQQKYPRVFPYFHLTYFGLSANFGKKNNIFLGGEVGIGFKGIFSMHGGYRF